MSSTVKNFLKEILKRNFAGYFLLIALTGQSAFGSELAHRLNSMMPVPSLIAPLECWGFSTNDENGEFETFTLKPQSYDRNYWEATTQDSAFILGALTYDVFSKGEIILLVSDRAAKRVAMLTAGFANKPNQTAEASQKYEVKFPSGRVRWLEVTCAIARGGKTRD